MVCAVQTLSLGKSTVVLYTVFVPEGDHDMAFVFSPDDLDWGFTDGQSVTLDHFRLSTDGLPMIVDINVPGDNGGPFKIGDALEGDTRPGGAGLAVVWSSPDLPLGLTIDPVTGVISGIIQERPRRSSSA